MFHLSEKNCREAGRPAAAGRFWNLRRENFDGFRLFVQKYEKFFLQIFSQNACKSQAFAV